MIDEIKIMQYVDGTLPAEEKEAVEKEIECEIYLKFAINQNGKLLLMVSCHPST